MRSSSQLAVDVETFLDELYNAAAEPDRWDAAVHAFMSLFQTDKSNLAIRTNATGVIQWIGFHGLSEKNISLGQNHYFALDPWKDAIQAMIGVNPAIVARSFVTQGNTLVPFREYAESEYYRDFCRHTGVDDCLVLAGLVDEYLGFSLTVNTGDGRLFTGDDVALANQLLPHVVRAMRLNRRLSRYNPAAKISRFWHDNGVAMILLAGGLVEYANAAAVDLFGAGDLVRCLQNRLQFPDPNIQSALSALVSRPARIGESQNYRTRAFHVATADLARWLVQFVRLNPTKGPLLSTGVEEPSILVAITPLNVGAAGRQQALGGFVELSAAEREILALLVSGHTVDRIARITDRSVPTVRWHIRMLLEKLNATSLADLIRLGSLLLPI